MAVTHHAHLSLFFGFSNPLISVLYIYSLVYFLSKNKKYNVYLINLYVSLASILAVLSLGVFLYKMFEGQEFIINDLYAMHSGGSVIQSIVALTFPLSAVIMVIKALKSERKILRVCLILLAFIIIFTDLFINRSKVGYLIEIMVLIYYSCVLVRKYSYKNDVLSVRRVLATIILSMVSLVIIFGVTFQYSTILKTRVTSMISNVDMFFKTPFDGKDRRYLSTTSTGLRLMYYSSSVKVFEQYPSVFLFGCVYKTNILNPTDCTKLLIKNNKKLNNDRSMVHNGIEAHNEFINYTLKGGILAGSSLFIFLVLLLYEARYLDRNYRNCLRIFVLAFFIGCTFDFFMTTQMMVATFATLLGVFLSMSKSHRKLSNDQQ